MRIDIITIFPEYLEPLRLSLVGKAQLTGRLDVRVHDLRNWTADPHRTVDDTPYGGGPGMVMKAEPWAAALDEILASGDATPVAVTSAAGAAGGAVASADEAASLPPRLVVPTPSGRTFTQRDAARLSAAPWLIFAPARYEGIDRRFIDEAKKWLPVDEVSIGDYVLAGGEVAVLVIVEAVARLLPGVLGNADSHRDDSFAPGAMADLLEGPAYTKPACWRGRAVPDVLLSGDHARIARWRRDEALRRTCEVRPDLVERADPESWDKHDRALLDELGWGRDGRFGRPPGVVEG